MTIMTITYIGLSTIISDRDKTVVNEAFRLHNDNDQDEDGDPYKSYSTLIFFSFWSDRRHWSLITCSRAFILPVLRCNMGLHLTYFISAMSKYQPGRCFFLTSSLQFFILFAIQIIIVVVVNRKYFIWSTLEEAWENEQWAGIAW